MRRQSISPWRREGEAMTMTLGAAQERDLELDLDGALDDYDDDDLRDLREGARRGWPFKRTQVLTGAAVVVLAILFLAYNGVRGTFEFFATTTEILAQGATLYDHQVRIGATVVPGSVVRN